jgi:hypothetical protein
VKEESPVLEDQSSHESTYDANQYGRQYYNEEKHHQKTSCLSIQPDVLLFVELLVHPEDGVEESDSNGVLHDGLPKHDGKQLRVAFGIDDFLRHNCIDAAHAGSKGKYLPDFKLNDYIVKDRCDESYMQSGLTINTKSIEQGGDNEKVEDRTHNAVDGDVHGVLEKFPLFNVVPILEQHGRE